MNILDFKIRGTTTMSLGEITNSREFLAPSTDIDDESCSYNEEEQDLVIGKRWIVVKPEYIFNCFCQEDRSDATYDVEYPFEVQPQADVGHKMNPERKEMSPSSEPKEEQSDFLKPQGLPKAESCNSLPTPGWILLFAFEYPRKCYDLI